MDIYNQGVENQGMVENPISPVQNLSPNVGLNRQMGGSPVSPMSNQRVNTPTSTPNIDPNAYQYAQLMHPPNTPYSPYPVQQNVFYQQVNGRQHSPHHETPRQVSPVHPGPPFYTYGPQTGQTVNLLRQVPPPAQHWGQQIPNYRMPMVQMPASPGQHVPPVPPRPSDLNIRQRGGRSGSGSIHTPNRPPPPPPTPPKLFSGSPHLERSRSSNEVQDNHHGEGSSERRWQCAECTFDNHEEINECEICLTPRHGSVGNIYNTLSPMYTEAAKDQRPHSSKRHHKSKKRSDRSPQ